MNLDACLFAPFLRPVASGPDAATVYELCLPPGHEVLAAHHVRGKPVLPGVAYFDLALCAASLGFPGFVVRGFEDCAWLRAVVGGAGPLRLSISLAQDGPERLRFAIADPAAPHDKAGWGVMTARPAPGAAWDAAAVWNTVTEHTVRRFTRAEIYAEFSRMGIDYGRFFRRIHYADIFQQQALALLSSNDGQAFALCNLLDCAFQSGMAVSIGTESGSLMPFSLGQLIMHDPIPFGYTHSYFVVTEKRSAFRTNIAIFSDDGKPLVSVLDLGVKTSLL